MADNQEVTVKVNTGEMMKYLGLLLPKAIWKSKTVIVNLATAIVAGGVVVTNYAPAWELIKTHPKMCSAFVSAYGIANLILRLITTRPVTTNPILNMPVPVISTAEVK